MRPSLFRAPGLLLCVTLAIAPGLAWAAPAPVRVNLDQSQSTAQEVRWQPIQTTETVTGPWELVGSRTWVQKSQPSPSLLQFQEYRMDDYRQRTTTYPQEAKEQRTKTTSTQRYELRTYAEQSTSSTVMVPVEKEVGEWVTTSAEKPVTVPVQELSTEPELVEVQVPVFKTVTSTYSIEPQPIYTTQHYTKTETVPQDETVTKTRTESFTTTRRNVYDGRMIDHVTGRDWGTVTMWTDEAGVTLNCPDLRLNYVSMRFTDGSKTKLSYTQQGWGRVGSEPQIGGTCVVTSANGTHYLEFEGDLRHAAWTHWWGAKVKVKLDNYLAYDTQVQATREVAYTETSTKMVTVTTPATFSLQLEQFADKPDDLQGTGVGQGVFWRHYHCPGIGCSYRAVTTSNSPRISKANRAEKEATYPNSPMLGKLADRIVLLEPEMKKGYTIVGHHTSRMPIITDAMTAAGVGTRQSTVLDYETRQEWSTKPHLVTKQVPVKTVVRWLDRGSTYQFSHTHDDPTIRCENKYLAASTPSGRTQAGGSKTATGGGKAPTTGAMGPSKGGYGGTSVAVDSNGGVSTIRHMREPVFGPLMETVTSTEWATRSVTVLEPRTRTSTYSVLVSTVPGQDISDAYSPWTATGEKRRRDGGSTREATKSVPVPLRAWRQDLTPVKLVESAPLKAGASSFASDRSVGGSRQAISGTSVRLRLRTTQALQSRPSIAQVTGTISNPNNGSPHKQGAHGGQVTAAGADSKQGGPSTIGQEVRDLVKELGSASTQAKSANPKGKGGNGK